MPYQSIPVLMKKVCWKLNAVNVLEFKLSAVVDTNVIAAVSALHENLTGNCLQLCRENQLHTLTQ